jgi:hypothetical protein
MSFLAFAPSRNTCMEKQSMWGNKEYLEGKITYNQAQFVVVQQHGLSITGWKNSWKKKI